MPHSRPLAEMLAHRKELPEALRVLIAEYPRTHWEGHDNFSDLTRFWLERHVMFREVLDRLNEDTRSFLAGNLDARVFAARSARLTVFFLNQLHAHHSIEDQHYFPMLSGLAPGLENGFALLDGDHHELEPLIADLATLTNAMLRPQDGRIRRDDVGRIETHLTSFQIFLDRHLTDEEELVVPTILKYGPPTTLGE